MEIKIGDKVYIEAEVVNIDKFSQHKYIVKLTSGEQRSISEKDVCVIVNDNEQDKKG